MTKVLIVEDDKALGLFLQKGLKMKGHDTAWVEDGELALEHLGAGCPDLMVLDLGLPRRDGMEVLQELRSLSPSTAVIVLTGRNDLEERIRCLNLGADDCLLKPFSLHELVARCGAILRRQKGTEPSVLRFSGIEMDLIRRKVRYMDRTPELTPKEFALLEALLRRKGDCCSRENLLLDVWQTHSQTETNVVDVCINSLRRKLAAPPVRIAGSAFIETVRGRGYRIASCQLAMNTTALTEVAFARGA